MIRKIMIKLRAFYILWIRNERCKQQVSGAKLWDIYCNEIIKMRIATLKKEKNNA